MEAPQRGTPTSIMLIAVAILVGFNLLIAGWLFGITALQIIGFVIAVITAVSVYVISRQQPPSMQGRVAGRSTGPVKEGAMTVTRWRLITLLTVALLSRTFRGKE